MIRMMFVINSEEWKSLERTVQLCVMHDSTCFGFDIGHRYRRFCYAGDAGPCPFQVESSYYLPMCAKIHYDYTVRENGQTGDLYISNDKESRKKD